MDLLYYVLSCYGITQIICFGKIFNSVRPSHYFFQCPMCMGFWVGLLVWGLNCYTELFIFDYKPFTGFLLAGLSSGTSYILNMLFCDDGFQVSFVKTKENQ